jgi:hypothetical protein
MTVTLRMSAVGAATALVVAGVALCAPVSAHAADEAVLAPLRGLIGARAAVEDIGTDAPRRGLAKEQVLADLETHLRDGGVRLLTAQELGTVPGRPRLLLRVVTVPNAQATEYACSLRLVLVQGVTLERDARIRVDSRTWETSLTGIAKAEDLIAVIRARACDLADLFAKDLRAATVTH